MKKLYKVYENDSLINYEYVVITEKINYCVVSEYVNFKKSGTRKYSSTKIVSWGYYDLVETFIKRGYKESI